jgi:hypothetical protein
MVYPLLWCSRGMFPSRGKGTLMKISLIGCMGLNKTLRVKLFLKKDFNGECGMVLDV